MAATAAEKRAYQRKLQKLINQFDKLDATTTRYAISYLTSLRDGFRAQLAGGQLTEFGEFRLNEQIAAFDAMIDDYWAKMRSLSNSSIQDSYSLGERTVVEPAQEVGLQVSFFRPSDAQLQVIMNYTADLIGGITEEMRGRIHTAIRLNALGYAPMRKAMRDIEDILGVPAGAKEKTGFAYRAERILRTETNRAYNVAIVAQQERLAEERPGLRKMWVATADKRTRISHLNAHRQIKPIDQPFEVGFSKLKYPLDPTAPAEETINCRCRSVTLYPGIDLPETALDQKIEIEKERRKQEKKKPKPAPKPKPKPKAAPKIVRPKNAREARKMIIDQGAQAEKEIIKISERINKNSEQWEELTEEMAQYKRDMQAQNWSTHQILTSPKYEELYQKRNALVKDSTMQRDMRWEIQERTKKQLRQLLYVDNPASIDINWKSVFAKSDDRRAAIINGVEEFKKLVSEDVQVRDPFNPDALFNIPVRKGGGGRSYHAAGTIYLTTGAATKTIVHEMGHWFEYYNEDIHQSILDFYDRRTAGETAETLNSITQSNRFFSYEVARPDKFMDPYMGKDYGRRATEILSMGLQYFYEKPFEFANDDPDMFDFIYDLVRGNR